MNESARKPAPIRIIAGKGRPEAAEAVHDLAARVEQREVDRARDADDERDGLRVEPDRHAPQRQDDLARRADGGEGCRGQRRAATARRRNSHIVRKTPPRALRRRRAAVGMEPVTASPVSSVDRSTASPSCGRSATGNCRSGSGPRSTSSTVATRQAPKNQIAACSSPNSDEQSRRDERADEHAEPERAAEQRERPRAERRAARASS